MVILPRGGPIGYNQTVQLQAVFRDLYGNLSDLTSFPTIQVLDPFGAIYLPTTSVGVYHISTGIYAFNFLVPLNGPAGIWSDNWTGVLGSEVLTGTLNFVVSNIPLSGEIDGYLQLGDPPDTQYSQTAIANLNVLIHILQRRLQSSGWHKVRDQNGNWINEDCSIFTIDELTTFLCSSLSDFNTTPHLTDFHWEDTDIIIRFRDILCEGAYIIALASKALIEKGKEFTISDAGTNFTPAFVAELLQTQASTLLSVYREKLKQIKYSLFKNHPIGLGTLRITAVAPQILRLRHLRARQFPV